MELSEKREEMSVEDMIEDLEQYYESAGFSDYASFSSKVVLYSPRISSGVLFFSSR